MDSDLAVMDEATPEVADAAAGGQVGGETAAEPGQGERAPVAAPKPHADAAAAPDTPAETPTEIDYPDDDAAEQPEAAAEQKPDAEAAETAQPSAAAARYGTAALTKLLKDQPELAKAAEASPRAKAQLYQMARRSQELAEYQDLVPSVTRAREAVEAQQALANYDRAYFGNDPEQFWRGLYDAQVGQDGRSTGVYERNVQFLQRAFMDGLEERARQSGDGDLQTALAAIRESLGWEHSRTPHSPAQDGRQRIDQENLPPQIRQRLQQAEQEQRELQQLRSRLSDGEKQANEKFMDETATEAAGELRSFVEGILANSRLSDYDKGNIARDFIEEAARLGDEDKVHNAALEEILRQGGQTPQTRARMVARIKQWARQNGREILEPILQRAGAGLKQKQVQREAVRSAARSEPASSGAPSRPAAPSGRDLVKQAEQKLGRRLSDREILDLA